jgi:hypothetical protein
MSRKFTAHPPQRKFKHYEFPYIRFHGKHYPLIPITLRRGKYAVSTFALLDSGASISVFRPEILKALNMPFNGKDDAHLGTASGQVHIGMSKVQIEVEQTKFSARVGFSDTSVASFNIIGREGFFHKFSICINEMLRTVIMVPLDQIK